MHPVQNRRGFTLIELLVVIAIIAILAAILFPVFAQVREKARIAACTSNCKQFALGIIQYVQDYDEVMPLTYKDANSFGPDEAQYNTNEDGGNQTPTGVPNEIMPYIKSVDVFKCPDDRPIASCGLSSNASPKEIDNTSPGGAAAGSNANPLIPCSAILGHNYSSLYGTSYKFTNQNFSRGTDSVSVASGGTAGPTTPYYNNTGYDAVYGGTSAASTKCVFRAQAGDVNTTHTTFAPTNAADWFPANTVAGYGALALSDFSRPSETRVFADWQKLFTNDPAPKFAPFHKNGVVIAYMDGHAKFTVSRGAYESGCDGADWAWDVPGSCNSKGLQRNKD